MRVGTVIKIIAVIVLTFVLAVAIAIGPSLLYMIATGQFHLFPTFVNTLDDPAVRAAFDVLNSYRVALSIPPVEFIQLETPLFRAKYMYDNNIYSHYDVEGRHPIYYYTILDGGAYAVEENIALQYFGVGTSLRFLPPLGILRKEEREEEKGPDILGDLLFLPPLGILVVILTAPLTHHKHGFLPPLGILPRPR